MTPIAGRRVAIANRAEIAVRIAATCRRMGATPILLVGEPDSHGFAARQVGRVELTGEAGSELDVERVISAAKRARADYLHPGYGFLSERAVLAKACEEEGILFVGPSAATLRLCGNKLATRAAATRADVPVLPASPPLDDDPTAWRESAHEVGYPLLVKPADAGGGRGLRHVGDESELIEAIFASRRETEMTSAGSIVYLERELVDPRHIEVQIAADGMRALIIGDRDCSIQRRHQKVIEEAPAPNLNAQTRGEIHEYARRIAQETGLRGIATCEFLVGSDGQVAFLEVNPRIQVEHPVTELVIGIDLVEWQFLIAAGNSLPLFSVPEPRGHAIEARIYAEDPWAGFFPAPGRLGTVSFPVRPGVRVDAGYESGDVVPSDYDSMIAKVIARGSDRESAVAELRLALLDTIVAGQPTNLPWLVNLLDSSAMRSGNATTRTAGEVAATMPPRGLAPVAAVAYLVDRSASDSGDPWTAIGPMRMSGSASVTVHGDDWEQRVAVARSTNGWEARLDSPGAVIRWWRDVAGIWTIASDDAVEKFAVIERGDELEICGSGGRWLIRVGPRPMVSKNTTRRTSDGQVVAPLPATVLGVHVKEGDHVVSGQALVTLYAMKMELVCDAPIAGVVEKVACSVSELVSADQVLVQVRNTADGSQLE